MGYLRTAVCVFKLVIAPSILIIGHLTWSTAFAQFEAGYKMTQIGRIIQVAANGTATENATDLSAALAKAQSLTPTATNPVVVHTGPGEFDFGTIVSAILMPDYVHLVGSGIKVTILKCDCSDEVILADGTNNRFSDLEVININTTNGKAVKVDNSAEVYFHDARTRGLLGVFVDSSLAFFYNSELFSRVGTNSGKEALHLDDSSLVFIEHSQIIGNDDDGDGLVTSGTGSNEVVIRYTLMGNGAVESPWDGTATCLATTQDQPGAFIATGCPAPPTPP